jgi:hypothetical protein
MLSLFFRQKVVSLTMTDTKTKIYGRTRILHEKIKRS